MAEIIEANIVDQKSDNETKKELENTLELMYKDQDNKITKALEYFGEYMYSVAQKYLTANGVMHALETLQNINTTGGGTVSLTIQQIDYAREIACDVSDTITKMIDEFNNADVWKDGVLSEDFKDFLDGWFEHELARDKNLMPKYLAYELLILDCLQMFSSSIDDIVNFYESTNEEIKKVKEQIKELD